MLSVTLTSLCSIKVLVISYIVSSFFSSYPSGVTEAIILAELHHEVLCYVPTVWASWCHRANFAVGTKIEPSISLLVLQPGLLHLQFIITYKTWR